MLFLSDGFAAESTLGPSAEGNKLKPMSVVLFLKGPNSFLETFEYRKRVIEVCSLLPESGVLDIRGRRHGYVVKGVTELEGGHYSRDDNFKDQLSQ